MKMSATIGIAAGIGFLCIAGASEAGAQSSYSVSIVHKFGANPTDPTNVVGALVLGNDGDLYGVSLDGGSANRGTIFKTALDGTVTILHSFSDGSVPNDGYAPWTGLTKGIDGNFYGVTSLGGVNQGIQRNTGGTVYKMTPLGQVTILHSFGGPGDGAYPLCTLTQGVDGTLYGATDSGGVSAGLGVIFSITPDGAYTILHTIQIGEPFLYRNGLTQANDGFLYSNATFGSRLGLGAIYRISTTGDYQVLRSLSDTAGNRPTTDLVLGNDGYFYGTADCYLGNLPQGNNGTVFRVDKSGLHLTVLHTFATSDLADGAYPISTLVMDPLGNFYGTTENDGANNCGTFYRIDSAGNYSKLVDLSGPDFGNHELSALTMMPNGDVYGVSIETPGTAYGSVWKVHNTTVAAPATRLIVSPNRASFGGLEAGVPFNVDVTARDDAGNIDTNYSGTVHFSSGDANATLPADLTLTHGVATVQVTMYQSASLTATDTVTPSISGSPRVEVNPTVMSILAPHSVVAGTPFNVNVSVMDKPNNLPAARFLRPLSFSSNTPRSTLPSPSPLSYGLGTFTATLNNASTSTSNFKITVSTADGKMSATSQNIAVLPAPASGLSLSIPSVIQGGLATSLHVAAVDPFGNVATGYNGTVHFTSSDGLASLPANTTLTNGVGTFNATLSTDGNQTITATDTVTPGIHGTSNTSTVLGAVYLLIVAPSHITSGVPFNVGVTAVDRYGRTAIGYNGTVKFYSNAVGASLPPNTTLTNGTATVSVTIVGNSTYKISAVDVGNASLHGTSASIMSGP